MNDRVILLHGLWMPGASMHWFATKLSTAGFSPEIFSYHSVSDGPDTAVPRLVERLQSAPADIVAHSLGGLIALQALCESPQLAVRRVVCLGSPLTGSGAVTGVLRWAPAAAVFGRSAALLQQGMHCWDGKAQVGVIAGRVPHGLGALFGGFSGEHDGTVAVDETLLGGVTDHVIVDASHSGLLFSLKAVDQTVAFLRAGRFLPA
ncbi:MAG: alpha/beta hydrolase fold family protein [Xanthomonadaceae bacterium]|nr:alpha/beta hydrolase fold family protein [Xanthomonadaceae bacterium]